MTVEDRLYRGATVRWQLARRAFQMCNLPLIQTFKKTYTTGKQCLKQVSDGVKTPMILSLQLSCNTLIVEALIFESNLVFS